MNKTNNTWKQTLWVLAGIGFLIGLYGLYDRLTAGHAHAAYGSYVPWGLWVATYTLLVGASAGAFMVAAVIFISQREEWYPVARITLLVALASFAGGMLNIWLDLGHPERFLRLYYATNFFSIMGLMAWFYLLYGLLIVYMLWRSWAGTASGTLRTLGFLAIPFAILFAGAEGALFGVVGARPMWESGLTPIIFLVEGGLAGVALAMLGNYVLGILQDNQVTLLGRVMLSLLVLVLLFEWAEYSTGLYAGIPAKSEALRTVLFGNFWWVFWIVHLLIGVLIPLLLLAFRPGNRSSVMLSALLIALTAIATKLNLVIPALAQPELEGLQNAFSGPGLAFNYFPTLPEWTLTLWTVSLAALIFLAGNRVLPKWFKSEVK